MREVDQRYLENTVGIPLVYLEALDGHGGSRVFPIAYFREHAVVETRPNAYELLLKNV